MNVPASFIEFIEGAETDDDGTRKFQAREQFPQCPEKSVRTFCRTSIKRINKNEGHPIIDAGQSLDHQIKLARYIRALKLFGGGVCK